MSTVHDVLCLTVVANCVIVMSYMLFCVKRLVSIVLLSYRLYAFTYLRLLKGTELPTLTGTSSFQLINTLPEVDLGNWSLNAKKLHANSRTIISK
jgi:hypothetical protein